MMVGSVSHLAPEQVLGTVYSGEKIDMWSVGVILYIMLTGDGPGPAHVSVLGVLLFSCCAP